MEKGIVNEYAVAPDVAAKLQSLQRVYDNFGVKHGRMISMFPGRWIREAEARLTQKTLGSGKTTASNEHAKCKSLILKLSQYKNTYFLKTARDYASSSWLEASLESNKQAEFAAIFGSSPVENHVLDIEEVDFADEKSAAYQPEEIVISRDKDLTPEDFISKLGVVLSCGKHYKLVDKNFSFIAADSNKFFPILKALLSRLQNRIKEDNFPDRVVKFDLILGDKSNAMDNTHSRAEMRRFAQQLRASLSSKLDGIDFSVCFFPWDSLHERLILVDWIGIKLDEGFDISNKDRVQPISRVSVKRHKKLWHDQYARTEAILSL